MNSIKFDLRQAIDHYGKTTTEAGYVDSYSDNIFEGNMPIHFQKMFDNGSGSELRSKAEAVHSSSMLSYNFFHWISEDTPLHYRNGVYTKVFFEVKMKTIKTSNKPANMDVVLVGEKDGKSHWLFIESKFLEYHESSKFELSDSYENTNKWLDGYSENFTQLISEAKTLCGKGSYGGGIKQSITHLFGIRGLKTPVGIKYFKNNNPKDLVESFTNDVSYDFINLIFEPAVNYEEHKSYEDYKSLYENFIQYAVTNVKIKPEWVTYTELWNEMNGQLNHDLQEYLSTRYMRMANIL